LPVATPSEAAAAAFFAATIWAPSTPSERVGAAVRGGWAASVVVPPKRGGGLPWARSPLGAGGGVPLPPPILPVGGGVVGVPDARLQAAGLEALLLPPPRGGGGGGGGGDGGLTPRGRGLAAGP